MKTKKCAGFNSNLQLRMNYINIHTHQKPQPAEWSIQNLHRKFEQVALSGNYSIGIHPWHIGEDWQNTFIQLAHFAEHQQVLAIGECGLDKVSSTAFDLQKQVFRQQIDLANQCQKPLIIHCVRAYMEVLQMVKEASVPVIFHGFAKSKALAHQIIDAGHYLSFGKALHRENIRQLLPEVPRDHLFLETDDGPEPITEIYRLAAEALSVAEDSLSLQLEKNVKAVFKIEL